MEFSHFNEYGEAMMVDIANKDITHRQAIAEGTIRMNEECFKKITDKTIKKGDVLGVAKIAGIMGAKKCSDLIPLCHQINLNKVDIEFKLLEESHEIKVIVITSTDAKTGVEMEALVGVNTTLLTIYDMCKAIDKSMEIHSINLVEKIGGKSGRFINESIKNDR